MTGETAEPAGEPNEGIESDSTSWWTIEGETASERVRNGLPQLAVLSVAVWVGTIVLYELLASTFGSLWATVWIVLGSLYVGLRLRRWLTDGQERDGDDRESENRGASAGQADSSDSRS